MLQKSCSAGFDLGEREALPPSVPLSSVSIIVLGVDIFVSSTGNFSIGMKKRKNEAFVGTAGESDDVIDFTGSEFLDGVEVDHIKPSFWLQAYKVDVCFVPVELDEKVARLHVECLPSLRRNKHFLEVSRSKVLLICTSRGRMCSSMSFPSSVGTPEVLTTRSTCHKHLLSGSVVPALCSTRRNNTSSRTGSLLSRGQEHCPEKCETLRKDALRPFPQEDCEALCLGRYNKRQYRKTHTERRKFRLCVALQTRGKFPGLSPFGVWVPVPWCVGRVGASGVFVLSSGSVGGSCRLAPSLWALSSGLCFFLVSLWRPTTCRAGSPWWSDFHGGATTQGPIFGQGSLLFGLLWPSYWVWGERIFPIVSTYMFCCDLGVPRSHILYKCPD